MTSTSWSKASKSSTSWTKGSKNATSWTLITKNSTGWGPGDLDTVSAGSILLQNGSVILLQDGTSKALLQ